MRLVLPSLALAASTMLLSGCGLFRGDRAVEHPYNVAPMVAKADALYAKGVADDARNTYRLALALDPSDAGAQMGLGRTLVGSDPRAAEAAFLAVLVREPDNVRALNDLGVARDMQGHHDEAQKAYRQALAVAPKDADVRTNLGLSLALSGDGAQAVQMLQPVAKAAEATPTQRANLALAMQANHLKPPDDAPKQTMPNGTARDDALPPTTSSPMATVADQSQPSQPVQPAPRPMVTGPEPDAGPAPRPPAAPRLGRPSTAGYYVQMGALDSAQAARAEWRRIRARWPDLLADRTPTVQEADVHDRTFWRLRTGLFASAGDANDFCARLHAAGSGCWTVAALAN
ncbi:MAG: SPOR domain-containing protein [Rhodopila sp.]|nr:SPOR domain-containing protein [Rhodopila sp.]